MRVPTAPHAPSWPRLPPNTLLTKTSYKLANEYVRAADAFEKYRNRPGRHAPGESNGNATTAAGWCGDEDDATWQGLQAR